MKSDSSQVTVEDIIKMESEVTEDDLMNDDEIELKKFRSLKKSIDEMSKGNKTLWEVSLDNGFEEPNKEFFEIVKRFHLSKKCEIALNRLNQILKKKASKCENSDQSRMIAEHIVENIIYKGELK